MGVAAPPTSGLGWRPVVLGGASFAGAAATTLLLWARGYPFHDLSRAYALGFGWLGIAAAVGLVLWAARLRRDPGSPETALAAWSLSALAVLAGMAGGWWVAEQALVAATATPHTAVDGAGPAPAPPANRPVAAPAGAGCDEAYVTGDVDGDGRDDQIVVVPTDARPVLRVCLASGAMMQTDSRGMGESLSVANVDDNGRAEIVIGASTAALEGVHIAVWHDGGPRLVSVPTGGPLELARGGDGSFDGHLWSMQRLWGCADRDGDGHDELVDVRAQLEGDYYLATITGYRLEGHRAHVATRDQVQLPAAPQPFDSLGIRDCRNDR